MGGVAGELPLRCEALVSRSNIWLKERLNCRNSGSTSSVDLHVRQIVQLYLLHLRHEASAGVSVPGR